MANEQNLQPVTSESEAREKGRAGGIASGIARRKKKSMREQMETLLSLPVNKENEAKMKKLGIEESDDLTNQMALLITVYQKALKGDLNAFKEIKSVVQNLGSEPAEGESNNRVIIVDDLDGNGS